MNPPFEFCERTLVMTEPHPVYVAQGGIRGREGGPYLDEIEAKAAEDLRAYRENRAPDYSKIAGLVKASQLVDNTYSNPGSRDIDPLARFKIVPKDPEDVPAQVALDVSEGISRLSPASFVAQEPKGEVVEDLSDTSDSTDEASTPKKSTRK